MKALLVKSEGGWERLALTTHAPLDGLSLDYVPKPLVSALAHALLLPASNFGHEGRPTGPPGEKLSGTVARPTGWLVKGRLVFERDVQHARQTLSAQDRWEIENWVSSARRRLMVGEVEFSDYVADRTVSMTPDEIRDQILREGGYRVSWRTAPLFRRQLVTPAGLAFWRLALALHLD